MAVEKNSLSPPIQLLVYRVVKRKLAAKSQTDKIMVACTVRKITIANRARWERSEVRTKKKIEWAKMKI